MGKVLIYTETVIASVEPERALRLADECLVELRLVEERKVANGWLYEFEVKGEAGKVAKFISLLKDIETGE